MTNEQLALLLEGIRDKLATRIEQARERLATMAPGLPRTTARVHSKVLHIGFPISLSACDIPEHWTTVELDLAALQPLNAMVDDLDRQIVSLRGGENGAHSG